MLLLAADRGTLLLVEWAAEGRIQDCLGASEKPDVSIFGFPFLTDLVRGRLGSMELTVRGRTLGGAGRRAARHRDGGGAPG